MCWHVQSQPKPLWGGYLNKEYLDRSRFGQDPQPSTLNPQPSTLNPQPSAHSPVSLPLILQPWTQGYENVFILIPLAAGLSDSEEMRERYFDMVMGRLERHTSQSSEI